MSLGRILLLILCVFCLCACHESERDRTLRLVKEWEGKEILFPQNPIFTIQGKDTVDFDFRDSEYKIVTYVDSAGCVGCKMQLELWNWFIKDLDSLSHGTVPICFTIHPEDKREIQLLLKEKKFNYPVCLDFENDLFMLNKFPNHIMLQTFLLNKDNRVIVSGNPIHNLEIWDLYLDIICNKLNNN